MDHTSPASGVPPEEEVRAEERRLRLFRLMTNVTRQRLCVEALSLEEARAVIDNLRPLAARFFPGREHVFDLVVAPRLERIIAERFGDACARPPRLDGMRT